MSESRAVKTKQAMVKVYAAGILVFSALFGTLTLVTVFLSYLKT